jgi:isoleucyl-tRNA synthetase
MNAKLESELEAARKVISMALSTRDQLKRGIPWPIKSIIVATKSAKIKQAIKSHDALIKQLVNVNDLKLVSEQKNTEYVVKLNYKVAGPKLGKDIKKFEAELLKNNATKLVAELRKKNKLTLAGLSVKEEDLVITESLPENLIGVKDGEISIYVDSEETPAMLSSGFAREIIRKVQDLRKQAGLVNKDIIALTLSVPKEVDVKKHIKEMQKKVGAKSISLGVVKGKHKDKFSVREKSFEVGF